MIQETIATGRDVNAAIDNGCRELGINRDEELFDFEIIAREKKGFLGLKTYPAKVRVFREVPDPKPVAEKREEKAPTAHTAPAPRQERQERPAKPPRPPREEKPREAREPRENREPKAPAPSHPRPPKQEKAPQSAPAHTAPAPQQEVEPNENVRGRIERSCAYVENILRIMGIEDVKVTPRYYSENVCLVLNGTGLGVIIGRRGETLDSLQYLASLVANRGEGDYIRMNIDSGNYREKRERTLEALAKKLAANAVRTGKSTTLEPMNPYERRVIHGAVSQVKGATSSSIGVDPNRRVVISAVNPPAKKAGDAGEKGRPRRDGRDGRDGRRRDGRPPRRDDRRSRPPRAEEGGEAAKAPRPKLDDGPAPERVFTPKPQAAPAPKVVELTDEEKEVAKKTSLYGKIEL